MLNHKTFLTIFISLIWTSIFCAGSLTLVEKGKSDYVIVRPEKSSESQVYAALELQRFLKEITGAELKIQTDSKALPAKAVLLGNTRFTSKIIGAEPDMKKLGTDGFRLIAKPSYLLIIGGRKRGTLYGVYELLEKYAGCRWYSSEFSVTPRRFTLQIPFGDDTQLPAFAIREPFYYDLFGHPDFSVRLRANGHEMRLDEKRGGHAYYANRWLVHTFHKLVPPEKYFKEHPEYYSLWKGKRKHRYAQLCLSNPDVLKIVTEEVKKVLRKDPGAKFISVSQTDGGVPCTCEKCKAFDEREGSPAGSIINFVNKVGAGIEKEFPGVYIETLAYMYSRKPPKNVRPKHNIIPRLCSVECDFSQPLINSSNPKNIAFRQDIEKWSKIAPKLLIWDYVTNFHHYIGPHPNFNVLQSNLQFFRDHNVYGMFEMGNYNSPHGEFAELRAWILAKLMWNPDQDVNKLYDDFFSGYYGAAAPLVRKYFDGLQKLSAPEQNEVTIRTKMTVPWLSDAFLKRSLRLFEQAEKLVAKDPARLYNVRMASIPVYYALLERWPEFKVKWQWENGGVKPVGVPPEYAALASAILERMKEGKVTRSSEYTHQTASFLANMRNYSRPAQPVIVRAGGLTAGILPAKGARVSLLKIDSGKNLVLPQFGGIDFTLNPKRFGTQWGHINRMEAENQFDFVVDENQTDKQSAVFIYRMKGSYTVSRRVSVAAEGITIDTVLKNENSNQREFYPHFRLAFDLGEVDSLYFKNGKSTWRSAAVPAGQTFSNTILRGDQLKSPELIVASAQSRQGLKITVPDYRSVDRIWICADTAGCPLKIIYAMKKSIMPRNWQKKDLKFRMSILPLKNITGLPDPACGIKHKAETVVIDDDLVTVANPGWGDYVADKAATDGHCLRTSDYPSWSVYWAPEPQLFIPGAKYKLQMLARVDKTGVPGEAFFAGVYDYNARKSLGDIKPRVSLVKDGYQWYDVAIFTPGAKQRVWAGPGRYDRKGGDKSAVKHLYIDKLRFVRTNETEIVKPGDKRPPADLVILEDCDLPLKPGWCKHVKDAGAGDKRALQLTTYPTWNMQWDVKPAWFNPGKYKVRMRIRVDKSGVPGEALWAGIYDYKTKRGPQISIKAENVKDGYQWYEIGSFEPGAKQRVWLGSGRYDRKGGGKSAVKGVYVDRIELKKEGN